MKGSPRMVWAAAIIVAVVLLAGDGRAQSPARRGAEEWPEAGFLAPDFALSELNGKQVKLSDFRGTKAVFLNFWASWCPSCQEEMPTMEKLYGQFKARGLEIVAVSIVIKSREVGSKDWSKPETWKAIEALLRR